MNHVALKDRSNDLRLLVCDDQLAVRQPIANRHRATHPHALAFRGRHLVEDALAGHLTLELGKRKQDVQRQPTHAAGCVERLGDTDE